MGPNFNGKPPAIPPGSLVLVTGCNGFIGQSTLSVTAAPVVSNKANTSTFKGSHVADQLLQAGYKVRGTSRDTTKTAWIKEYFDKKYGDDKFEAVVVKDMATPGCFDEACKGKEPSPS